MPGDNRNIGPQPEEGNDDSSIPLIIFIVGMVLLCLGMAIFLMRRRKSKKGRGDDSLRNDGAARGLLSTKGRGSEMGSVRVAEEEYCVPTIPVANAKAAPASAPAPAKAPAPAPVPALPVEERSSAALVAEAAMEEVIEVAEDEVVEDETDDKTGNEKATSDDKVSKEKATSDDKVSKDKAPEANTKTEEKAELIEEDDSDEIAD